MKAGDAGFRPTFTVQMASTCKDLLIVGVDVTHVGSDLAQLAPMRANPRQDRGHCTGARARVQRGDDDTQPADKHQRKEGDSEPVTKWRARMAGDEIKQQNKQRAATAECVNALSCNRALQHLPACGLSKVHAVAYL